MYGTNDGGHARLAQAALAIMCLSVTGLAPLCFSFARVFLPTISPISLASFALRAHSCCFIISEGTAGDARRVRKLPAIWELPAGVPLPLGLFIVDFLVPATTEAEVHFLQ